MYSISKIIIISILKFPLNLLCNKDSPLQSSGSTAWCRTRGLQQSMLLPLVTLSYIFIYIFLLLYNHILFSMCNLNPSLRLYSIVCINPRFLVVYQGGPLLQLDHQGGPLLIRQLKLLSLVANNWWTNYLWWIITIGYYSICVSTILDVSM